MIVLAMLALVVISVPLFGGRLSRLALIPLRHSWLVLSALALQTVVISVMPDMPHAVASGIHVLSYVMAAMFFVLNRRLPGLWVVAIGGGMNMAAIFANGGTMPAGEWATRVSGLVSDPGEFENSKHLEDARLLIFGDILPIPEAWPLSNVFSIGDIILVIGAAVVFHRAAGSTLRGRPALRRRRHLTAV